MSSAPKDVSKDVANIEHGADNVEGTRIPRDELELQLLARTDGSERDVHWDPRGVEVDRVRHGALVHQRHLHLMITLAYADHRPLGGSRILGAT